MKIIKSAPASSGEDEKGAAFNQRNGYTPSVSDVKGLLQKKCRKNSYHVSLKTSSQLKQPVRGFRLKADGWYVRLPLKVRLV